LLAALLTAAACTSTAGPRSSSAASEPARAEVVVGRVRVGELIGLSLPAVRRRLMIRPSEVVHLSAAKAESSGELLLSSAFDLTQPGGSCASLATITLRSEPGGPWARYPMFVFKNDRLEEVVLEPERVAPGDTELVASCRKAKAGVLVEAAFFGVFYAPWVAIDRLQRAPDLQTRKQARLALNRLSLGAPLPGGFSSYTSGPPEHVGVTVTAGEAATLSVNLGEDRLSRQSALVKVAVVNGRVSEIGKAPGNYHTCTLTEARAFDCRTVLQQGW
jgi:hypothetical protein